MHTWREICNCRRGFGFRKLLVGNSVNEEISRSFSLRAYSFGHLKSAKSCENGRLCRENFQLPKEWEFCRVELADFAEKNAKRIRILKTVGLADFAEKNAKRMGMEC